MTIRIFAGVATFVALGVATLAHAQIPPAMADQSPQVLRAQANKMALHLANGAFLLKDSSGCYWNVIEDAPGNVSLHRTLDQQQRPLCDQ